MGQRPRWKAEAETAYRLAEQFALAANATPEDAAEAGCAAREKVRLDHEAAARRHAHTQTQEEKP